jgi:hypothetical protein
LYIKLNQTDQDMADIKGKSELWQELECISSGIQFPAELEQDHETLALAKVIQYALTAVKDPTSRDQLIRTIDTLKEIPSDQDIRDMLHEII